MVLFKISGERNSGTTFLCDILRANKFPVYDHKITGKTVRHWKHGVPIGDYKKLNERVVDLFIFRNLDDWLLSMFNNPYELQKARWNNDFKLFLTVKQSSCNYWKDSNNVSINADDNDKTIFEIREYKFKNILEYKNKHEDVILINLSFIQNDEKLTKFLDFLSEKYMPNLNSNMYTLSIKHTKDKSDVKNRKYVMNIDDSISQIIISNKNVAMENFINQLTFG